MLPPGTYSPGVNRGAAWQNGAVSQPSPTPPSGPRPDGSSPPEGGNRILTVLLVPLFLSLMSVSVMNVALPAIEDGLGATSADLQWALSGYTLAFGVVLVAAGRAGDLWGRKRFFILGILLFTVGSLAAGLATTPLLLNLARLLTGIGSGFLNPQIIGIIQNTFQGQARGRAYGLFGTVIGLGVAVGPLMGGLLLQLAGPDLGWRLTFLVNVPIGLLAALLAWRWLQEPRTASAAQPRSLRALDPWGAVLLGAGIIALLIPFILPGTWILLVPAAVLLGVWWWWETHLARRGDPVHQPMVNPALFRVPSFTFGTVTSAMFLATMPGVWVVQAIFTQQGLGLSALLAGLTTLPSAVLVAVFSPVIGARVYRHGPVFVVIGAVLALVSLGAASLSMHLISLGTWPYWTLAASLGLLGLSQAFLLTSTQVLTMHDVPVQAAGAAGGVSQTAQRVLTAVGLAAVTGAFYGALDPEIPLGPTDPSAADTAVVFGHAGVLAMIVVAGFWAVTLVAGVLDLIRRRRAARTTGVAQG